eukprot:4739415-Prymnesium_polylepis.1
MSIDRADRADIALGCRGVWYMSPMSSDNADSSRQRPDSADSADSADSPTICADRQAERFVRDVTDRPPITLAQPSWSRVVEVIGTRVHRHRP